MNNMAVIVMCVSMFGCASTVSNVPLRQPKLDDNKAEAKHEVDGFDKAGFVLADGSRFVWDETKQAYNWITSDENKKRLEHAYDIMKSVIVGGYDAARDELNKQEKEGK